MTEKLKKTFELEVESKREKLKENYYIIIESQPHLHLAFTQPSQTKTYTLTMQSDSTTIPFTPSLLAFE